MRASLSSEEFFGAGVVSIDRTACLGPGVVFAFLGQFRER
jgi:hypothetical protein